MKRVFAALLALSSIPLFAQQDAGYWRAASKTAQSVTGDIALGGEKISINFNRYTLAEIRKLNGAEVSALFDVTANENNRGDLYRLSIPAGQKFLRKNTLCGSDDTQWLATFVEGKQLHAAFFSG